MFLGGQESSDMIDRVLHGQDFFGFLVGDFEPELLFHAHHQLDDVEGVGTQVIDEG